MFQKCDIQNMQIIETQHSKQLATWGKYNKCDREYNKRVLCRNSVSEKRSLKDEMFQKC